MNARPPLGFKGLPFSIKLALGAIIKSTLMAQQKYEYIKQLASKVEVLATHNKMLEASKSTKSYLIWLCQGRAGC